jgi:hypothetical protein
MIAKTTQGMYHPRKTSGAGEEVKEYAEPLPEGCPPDGADDVAYDELYRLLQGGNASPEEFVSHAARGETNRGNVGECRFRSCSLLGDYRKYLEFLPAMRKKHTHVAKLKIPTGVGASKQKAHKGAVHVDFWCFKGNDLSAHVVEVVPIPPEDSADA